MNNENSNESRIILSGGAGFVGSHLVDRLLSRNDIGLLLVVDNLWTGLADNLSHIKDSRLQFIVSDIENFQCDILFDEVYHLASPASPPVYALDPVRTIKANVFGALRLKELLKPSGVFCYTSSSEVYGDPLISPQPEHYRGSVDCTGPRSAYDEGKRCTEAFLFECQRLYGLRVKVVRPFNIYGPRTKADDGRAVSNFINQALSGQPITVYGDGKQTRSWGYISDIIEGMERFFWRDQTCYSGPLNIGNNREISVLEVAQYVASLVPKSKIAFLPPTPQDPTNRCPDLTLVNRILPNWECKVKYEHGIRLTLDWFKNQRTNKTDQTLLKTDAA